MTSKGPSRSRRCQRQRAGVAHAPALCRLQRPHRIQAGNQGAAQHRVGLDHLDGQGAGAAGFVDPKATAAAPSSRARAPAAADRQQIECRGEVGGVGLGPRAAGRRCGCRRDRDREARGRPSRPAARRCWRGRCRGARRSLSTAPIDGPSASGSRPAPGCRVLSGAKMSLNSLTCAWFSSTRLASARQEERSGTDGAMRRHAGCAHASS